jgi:hypothetical protein
MLLLRIAVDQSTIATEEATVKIRANAWFKCPLSAIAARHASAVVGCEYLSEGLAQMQHKQAESCGERRREARTDASSGLPVENLSA